MKRTDGGSDDFPPLSQKRGGVTDILRSICLAKEEGSFIGTEESLTRHFGISGPTLRKSIRVLEHEEVVAVRRGVKGGFFASRPKLATVSRLAAVFLSGHPDAIDGVPPIMKLLVPLQIDYVLRSGRLAELEPYAVPRPKRLPYQAFLEDIYRFAMLLQDMIDNQPLQICLSILGQAGLTAVPGRRASDDAGQMEAQAVQVRTAQALLAGDREAAITAYLELKQLVQDGIERHMGRDKKA
jgi:hypothetical protein